MITIHANIKAPVNEVWNYYTNPEHIINWNFANDDWKCPSASNDLIRGGRYKARMEAKDGSFGFDFEAVYDEVIPGKKLTYTLADARHVSVEFIPEDENTLVTINFDPESQNSEEMQKNGWQAILDNFKKYAEKFSR